MRTRTYLTRCGKCKTQVSRLSNTPWHHLKLPRWMIGFAVSEAVVRFPALIPSTELSRRLGISESSALRLKRRVQLFAHDQMDSIKSLMHQELKSKFRGTTLPPEDKNVDLRKDRRFRAKLGSIAQCDTLALFSASQRANGGRKRYKHSGQTASLYLSERLGGRQIGTMTHILSWRGGPILLDSIPDQKAQTIGPLLDKYIPHDVPFFTDEGYRFYARMNKNHRMVSHSSRSPEKRYRWGRDRWCKNGVHSQTAEGNGRAIKQAFAVYNWIDPKYSQLYLSEYAFLKGIKYYGLEKIAERSRKLGEKARMGSSARGERTENGKIRHQGTGAYRNPEEREEDRGRKGRKGERERGQKGQGQRGQGRREQGTCTLVPSADSLPEIAATR
ncbi:MAG: transposase [Leptospirales bacterium]|nr:transposase [Leptospirales bacterium]